MFFHLKVVRVMKSETREGGGRRALGYRVPRSVFDWSVGRGPGGDIGGLRGGSVGMKKLFDAMVCMAVEWSNRLHNVVDKKKEIRC